MNTLHKTKQTAPNQKQIELLNFQHPINFGKILTKKALEPGIMTESSVILVPVLSIPTTGGLSFKVPQSPLADDINLTRLYPLLKNNLVSGGDTYFINCQSTAVNLLFVHIDCESSNQGNITLGQLRSFAQSAAVKLKTMPYKKVFFALQGLFVVRTDAFGAMVETLSNESIIRFFINDFCYGLEDNTHKTNKIKSSLETCCLIDDMSDQLSLDAWIQNGLAEYNGERIARLFADARASTCTPEWSLKMLEEVSFRYGLEFTYFDSKYLRDREIGGIDDVARGSQHNGYLAMLHYKAPKNIRSGKNIVTINKWLTFDQGGLQNKPDSYEMWTDMAGGAAGLGAIISIAKKQALKDDFYAFFPICENMVSSSSMFPGDSISYVTKRDQQEYQLTVEVTHTDAEGRLVMTSGHAWAAGHINDIRLVINTATLTGGALHCSGKNRFPFFANSEKLTDGVTKCCWSNGEEVQPQIADYSQEKLLKSDFADIANSPRQRGPSCMLGYLFMKKGVETFYPKGTPHVHLDIAPTAYRYNPIKGRIEATGSGVKALEAIAMAADNICH